MQIKIFSSANRSCGGRDGLASRLKVTMVVERVKDADQLSPRVRDHNPRESSIPIHNPKQSSIPIHDSRDPSIPILNPRECSIPIPNPRESSIPIHNPKECTELHNHPTGQKGRPIHSSNFVFNFVQLTESVFFWENMSLYSHQSRALSMFMSSSTLLEAAAADKWRG